MLPACVAWTMQVPWISRDKVLPATEQTEGVVEAKLTGRLELAVADSVNWVETYWGPAMGVKLMVCGAMVTAKLCAAGGAAA